MKYEQKHENNALVRCSLAFWPLGCLGFNESLRRPGTDHSLIQPINVEEVHCFNLTSDQSN